MAYTKTNWKDRNIQRPNTFNMVQNPDGTVILIPVPGTVSEVGTPVNASNLNKIEDAIYNLDSNKVDKVSGKGLSTNDYTATDKAEVGKVKDKADINYVNGKFESLAIVQSGKNEFGSWIKYGDGTMECWRRHYQGDYAFTTKQAEYVYGYWTPSFTFPVQFVGEVPTVNITVSSNGLLNCMYGNITVSAVTARVWSPLSGTHSGVEIAISAKGRWK